MSPEDRVDAVRARLGAIHCSWTLEYMPNYYDRSILSSDVMNMAAERKAFGDFIRNVIDDVRALCEAIKPLPPSTPPAKLPLLEC